MSASKVTRRQGLKKDASKTDYRHSLQVESNETSEHDSRRFGSLPRRQAPKAPSMRREVSSNSPTSSSSFKGHSPSQLRSSPPRKTSADGPVKVKTSTSSPAYGRRYSADAGAGQVVQNSLTKRTYSTSYVGEGERSGLTVMNSPKKSVFPGNTRRQRAVSDSHDSDSSPSHFQQRSRSASRDSNDILLEQPEPKIELLTSFAVGDGTELVEAVRKGTGVSYRKSLLAISGVMEFLKNKVPVCSEMVDALLSAVQQSQVSGCTCMCVSKEF